MADNIVITAELKDLVSGHLKDITAQVNKLEGSLSNVGKSSGGSSGGMIGSFIKGSLITNGIMKVSGVLKDFGLDVVDSLSKYEMFSSSLNTLMGGNGLAADALKGQLVQLAKTTPFSLEDVQAGTKSLLAYGFQAGSITDNLKTLGDVSSGVGAPLNDIVYLYGTLKTQGRAFSKDITQFTGRGIPIIKELANQFGVAESKVMGLVEKGKVGFPEIEKAFNHMTSAGGQFFGMMDNQSKTIGGQISNMGDNWEQAKIEIGKSQSGIISGTVSFFSDLISSFKDYYKAKNFEDGKYNEKPEADLMDRSNKERAERTNSLSKLKYTSHLRDKDKRDKQVDDQGVYIYGKDRARKYNEKITSKMDTESDVNTLENFLKGEVNLINEQFKAGKMSEKLRGNELLTLGELAKRITGLRGLNKLDPTKPPKDGATGDSASLEKVAKANRPTQINVNIENLVREINNTYQNTKSGMELTGEQIAKILIGAVNDVSVTNFGN